MNKSEILKPQYKNIHDWEFYSSNLKTEYQQSIEEGLDIEKYKDLFYQKVLLHINCKLFLKWIMKKK